jgi:hypothetical protein
MKRVVTLVVVALVQTVLGQQPAMGQTPCSEPDDQVFRVRMATVEDALTEAEFETALTGAQWLEEHFVYPPVSYYLARALHGLERYAEAGQGYQVFLWESEDCPEHSRLRERAVRYRREVSALVGAETTTNGGGAPADPEGEDDATAWILIGSGAALLVSGIVFDVATSSTRDDLDAALQADDGPEIERLLDETDTYQLIDVILYGGGLALGAVGLALLLSDSPGSDDEESVHLHGSLRLGPEGAFVQLSFPLLVN